jgi:hypothetical protein
MGPRIHETSGVIGGAGDKRIHAETTEYPFTEAVTVYEKRDAGRLLAALSLCRAERSRTPHDILETNTRRHRCYRYRAPGS